MNFESFWGTLNEFEPFSEAVNSPFFDRTPPLRVNLTWVDGR